jgi:hypothetical protein
MERGMTIGWSNKRDGKRRKEGIEKLKNRGNKTV